MLAKLLAVLMAVFNFIFATNVVETVEVQLYADCRPYGTGRDTDYFVYAFSRDNSMVSLRQCLVAA